MERPERRGPQFRAAGERRDAERARGERQVGLVGDFHPVGPGGEAFEGDRTGRTAAHMPFGFRADLPGHVAPHGPGSDRSPGRPSSPRNDPGLRCPLGDADPLGAGRDAGDGDEQRVLAVQGLRVPELELASETPRAVGHDLVVTDEREHRAGA